jgi:hypothetical protein
MLIRNAVEMGLRLSQSSHRKSGVHIITQPESVCGGFGLILNCSFELNRRCAGVEAGKLKLFLLFRYVCDLSQNRRSHIA